VIWERTTRRLDPAKITHGRALAGVMVDLAFPSLTKTKTCFQTRNHTYLAWGGTNAAQSSGSVSTNLILSRSDVLECFGEVKMLTDELIKSHHLDTTHKVEIAGSNRLCAALVVEAMEKLGMFLRTAAPGQLLDRVFFLPQHRRLMECVYEFLERDARLINIDAFSGQLIRTHVTASTKSSRAVFRELLDTQPAFAVPNRLTYYAGQSLADVLSGKTDGVRVIFGTPEGRELVQAMYCEHTFNRMDYVQMREVISLLADRVKHTQPGETLKILEMGAGTGGTTLTIAPFLASIADEIPVEYTLTDLSPSMVANARRTFGKKYPFMKFAVHDIETPPADDHKGQHIVLASNAVHATHDLVASARNIRQALRPDGFVMILEMTEVVPFVDLVFGLLEGWWLFDDGRQHAVVSAEHWERELHTAGFGHVDWTDGSLPENAFQKVIMALASGQPEAARLPKALSNATTDRPQDGEFRMRKVEAEGFISKYSQGWVVPELEEVARGQYGYATPARSATVLVTGATGSLGAHLVQEIANNPSVATVVCINRASSMAVETRQQDAFFSRGIELSSTALAKLKILEMDTSLPQLGLALGDYNWLVENGTHIVHNGWPMSGTRPIRAFESQFQALRNLLDLARSMAIRGNSETRVRIGFQFVSSIGVVGYSEEKRVLERRVPLEAVMPGGYTDAKWTCERLLEETLHGYPKLFRPFVSRPGQISGSTESGVWNPVEHFAFLVKSAQSLRAWPDFEGTLQWIPVDSCAQAMVDLLKIGNETSSPDAHAVYHIDNPVGQPWTEMSPVLAAALNIAPHGIIPFAAWIKRIRRSPLSPETDIPAARLVDFLEVHFQRMSCGGLILDTKNTKQHSETMAAQGPVSAEVARSYIEGWKKMGFLTQ
jgi:thioester reductase-like protein/SAM-dependent methyltransferase